jgi:hypothetical protein
MRESARARRERGRREGGREGGREEGERPGSNQGKHTSAYVSMRRHTSAYVSIRQHDLVVTRALVLDSQILPICCVGVARHAVCAVYV